MCFTKKHFATVETSMVGLSVSTLVRAEIRCARELFVAQLALEGFLSRVDSHVRAKVRFADKSGNTCCAFVFLHSNIVNLLVPRTIPTQRKFLGTKPACKDCDPFSVSVYFALLHLRCGILVFVDAIHFHLVMWIL
eukprot:m.235591 g.235591  ORF g.235591 m.235591 type:complete len:136 (+) comp33666_c3_seq5:149-556(+)